MSKFFFVCSKCNSRFGKNFLRCPICGGLLITKYESFSWELLDRGDIWRYSRLLPKKKENIVTLGEGGTPIIRANNLARRLGLKELFIKDETRNPTGSFVDRGISVVVSNVESKRIICPTRGDTGASLAVYSAKAGLEVRVYAPRDVDLGKLYIMLLAGADVRIVSDFLSAIYLAELESIKASIFMEISPFYIEGIKTIAYEIMEQLGGEQPDVIIAPVGSGALISALWKGFEELKYLGLINQTPKFVGVQVEGVDPVVMLFRRMEFQRRSMRTLARDTELFIPELAEAAISAIRNSGGTMISVNESRIPEYIRLLAQTEGIVAEPSAILPVIAIQNLLDNFLESDMRVVAIITGSGLRTPDILRNLLPIERLLERTIGETGKIHPLRIGETKIRILKILREKPQHGYGLQKELTRRYNKKLSMPTIYQHLKELEKMGLISRIERKEAKRKILYVITKEGLKLMKKIGYP